jgi:hypothetical protein
MLGDSWGPGSRSSHSPESLSGDFRELYLLSRDELRWSEDARPSILDSDGNQPRRDDEVVQQVRKRMCYQLIGDVGAALHGKGAGIFSEQQESIAEMMVDSGGKVLSNYDFRHRILELPGWEQFTALFLFFISEDDKLNIAELDAREQDRARFVAKLPYEVDATIEALARLEARLTKLCGIT